MGDTPWLDAIMRLLGTIYNEDADGIDEATQAITELNCTTEITRYEKRTFLKLWQLLSIGKIPMNKEED